MTIVCDIEILSNQENNIAPLTKRRDQLCEDFSNLFTDETASDVKIKCGTKTFHCHWGILSARSPVFRAMLQADMEEKREGIVEIKDFGIEVVEAMLFFMYTATVSATASATARLYSKRTGYFTTATGVVYSYEKNHRDHFSELLKAADQYQLDLLKAACEDALCCGLEVENCLISLILGDMYQAEKLKKNSMKFFIENMNKVIQCSDDWKKCVKSHPDLTVEITEEIARRQCTAISCEFVME